jgi:uncharacterized protein Usg
MPETTLLRQLEGFSLTTAEILYRLPDYPRLLQSYFWQDDLRAPDGPHAMQATIPPEFWAELKRQNLIEQNAPTPTAASSVSG